MKNQGKDKAGTLIFQLLLELWSHSKQSVEPESPTAATPAAYSADNMQQIDEKRARHSRRSTGEG